VSKDRSTLTLKQLSRDLRTAPPPTDDDVSVTLDGRRLDSEEAVLAWLAEVEADRRAGHLALDELP
jgi:hypothetical protein